MKKAIGIIVLLILMTAMLVNCPGEKVVIKAMAYGNEANQEGQNWMRIVDRFQKDNPNITIEYELLYDEVYHNKVTANLAGGDQTIPDFAYMGADARWGTPWKEAAQQFDHKPYMDTNYYDMSLVPPMGPNGEIWEIPLTMCRNPLRAWLDSMIPIGSLR
jgi:raffinose/stachyose/melibiose transport system substrate-binding protein